MAEPAKEPPPALEAYARQALEKWPGRGPGPTGCSIGSGGPPRPPCGQFPLRRGNPPSVLGTALFFKGNFFRTGLYFAGGSQGGARSPLAKEGGTAEVSPTAAPALKDAAEVVPQPPGCGSERGGPALTSKIPARQGRLRPKGPLDNWRKNAYNHKDFTAMTPQQYSMRRSQERDPLAGRVPSGPEEGQRRSGGGNAHGPLPVPGG